MKADLIAARDLIANIDGWTQGLHAIEHTGAEADVHSDDAYAFCADGACMRVTSPRLLGYDAMARALGAAFRRLHPGIDEHLPYPHVRLNDGEYPDIAETPEQCHAAILRVFDNAIEHAS